MDGMTTTRLALRPKDAAAGTDSPLRLLLTPREAAEALSVSDRTLWAWTAPRGPIPCVRIGRCARYTLADLEAFAERQKVAEPGRQGCAEESQESSCPTAKPPL